MCLTKQTTLLHTESCISFLLHKLTHHCIPQCRSQNSNINYHFSQKAFTLLVQARVYAFTEDHPQNYKLVDSMPLLTALVALGLSGRFCPGRGRS